MRPNLRFALRRAALVALAVSTPSSIVACGGDSPPFIANEVQHSDPGTGDAAGSDAATALDASDATTIADSGGDSDSATDAAPDVIIGCGGCGCLNDGGILPPLPCTGRRPEGFAPSEKTSNASAIGNPLAEFANLEAASVYAFRVLARELKAHGAPAHLIRKARRSAREEITHARMMTALAKRAGARVVSPKIARHQSRSLEAMAVENAVEGCVRETFGAALAHVQSERAQSIKMRAVLRAIARDELRHAELAWEVAEWIHGKLDSKERERVREARARAIGELEQEVRREPSAGMRVLGLPASAQAFAMFEEMRRSVWS